MSRVFLPGPVDLHGFANNPPTGGIVAFNGTGRTVGFISTPASYGVTVKCYESQGRAYLKFYRMYGKIGVLHLDYATSNGTAIAGVDYTATSGTVDWADQEYGPKTVEVPLLATSDTTNKIFNVTVSCRLGSSFFPYVEIFHGGDYTLYPNGANFSNTGFTFPVTIVRQGNGTISFVGTPYSVQRPGGSTTVTLQVQRTGGFKGAIGCSFHTTDGTAIAGVAYTTQTGTLSFANGDAGPESITITILNGGAGTQSFTVTIDTPTGGVAIGTIPTATVNIVAAAPPTNPVSGGSIPDQIVDNGDTDDNVGDSITVQPANLVQSAFASVLNDNILVNAYPTNGPRLNFNSTFWISTTVGWIVGDGGYIIKTTDGGVTWTIQTSTTNTNLRDVYFADANNGWAVGFDGVIIRTSNGGTTWAAQTSGTLESLQAVSFISTTVGVAVGDGGTILTTANGGTTWTPQVSGVGANLKEVHYFDATHIWAVSDQGHILFSSDGVNWVEQTSGVLSGLNGIYFASALIGFAVGDGGVIIATANGGTNWAVQASGTTSDLNDVNFQTTTLGWAVGNDGVILISDGSTWTAQTSPVTSALNAIDAASALIAYAVGDLAVFLATGNAGTTWTQEPAPSPIGVAGPDGGSFGGSNDAANIGEGFQQTTPFRFQGLEY